LSPSRRSRPQLGLALAAFTYATGSLIPLEVYEIVREAHPLRVVILVLNIAVVVYLLRRRDVFE